MKNVLFLASVSLKNNRLDGVTIKSRTLYDWLVEKNVHVNLVDTDKWNKNFFLIIYKIFIFLKKSDVIVICSADRGAYYALKLLNLFKVKKNIYYFVAGGRLGDRVVNKEYKINSYKKCTKIYVESEKIKNQLNSMNLNNIEVTNNFRKINFKKEVKELGICTKFIYFGRVIPEKGIEDSLIVVNNLINKGYEISYDIYGEIDNDYLKYIEKYLNNNIIYKGTYIPDGYNEYELFSKYDALLFPTKYKGECLPGTLIEAYISGLAILASNWRYAKEYIEDDKVGYIFNFNDLKDFEIKLEKMLGNKEKVYAFKCNAQKFSENFNIDYVLNNFLEELKVKEETINA